MFASGGLAGLAGRLKFRPILASYSRIIFRIWFYRDYCGVSGTVNPVAVIVAGLVVALAELGGDAAQISLGVPKVVTGVFKGILLFMLLSGETLTIIISVLVLRNQQAKPSRSEHA